MNTMIKPLLKYTVQPTYLDKKILLRNSSITYEIDDPDNTIQQIIQLMDGNNTIVDIALQASRTQNEILDLLKALDNLKLIEDKKMGENHSLTNYDLSRWARNLNFFGSFCSLSENKFSFQEKIKNTPITILGLGGLGSHLLFDLAAIGFTKITAVEFDTVDISNLNRQILYTDNDIGKSKALLAQTRITQFSKHIDINIINKKLSSTDDVIAAIDGSECVICVADRPKTEILQWVNSACVTCQIPLITGGLDTQKARYYSMIPKQSGCLACWKEQVDERNTNESKILDDQQDSLRGDNAAFVAFVAIIAGYMCAEIVKLITNISPPISVGKVQEIDFRTMSFITKESWSTHPSCPICKGC